jgi:hypothetical protein
MTTTLTAAAQELDQLERSIGRMKDKGPARRRVRVALEEASASLELAVQDLAGPDPEVALGRIAYALRDLASL